MSVRKRTWTTSKSETKEAWVGRPDFVISKSMLPTAPNVRARCPVRHLGMAEEGAGRRIASPRPSIAENEEATVPVNHFPASVV